VENTKGLTTMDVLSAEQIGALHERLLSEKQRILDMYEADVRAGQLAGADDGTEDIVDQANKAWNREFMFSLSDNERKHLLLIEAALGRLEAGSYGICLHSGEPIAFPRLLAVPWARYTVDIQERIEKGLLEEDEI
jgi:DnaK suppressor protein